MELNASQRNGQTVFSQPRVADADAEYESTRFGRARSQAVSSCLPRWEGFLLCESLVLFLLSLDILLYSRWVKLVLHLAVVTAIIKKKTKAKGVRKQRNILTARCPTDRGSGSSCPSSSAQCSRRRL